jgi:hypothetical protein
MLFETSDPLRSRWQFNARVYVNMAHIAIIFVAAVLWLSFMISRLFPGDMSAMLVGDAIALGVAYCLYAVWEKRPITLACRKCEGVILSNTPWTCGVCKKSNLNAAEYPFVHKCQYCGAEPKSYKCHHCGALIFFSRDEDSTNYAYALNSPAEMPKPDERVEKLKKARERKEEKEMQLQMAQLEEHLKRIRERIRGEKQKKPGRTLGDRVAVRLELEDECRKLKAAIAKKYKKDEGMRERAEAAVDFCFNEMLSEDEEK